ncbi:metal-sulfur cluster assembly factor [Candidatus Woesearchaeota archaeon]|nr:metal-sulfur cluster assembly factor [Candidatus Woesearchaeota archaeon]
MVKKEGVMKALKKVLDPEIGINIVDLGLIYEVRINSGLVEIDMTLTSPGCPIAPQLMSEAEKNVNKLKGVKKTTVEFVFDPPWKPDKMSAEARKELGI